MANMIGFAGLRQTWSQLIRLSSTKWLQSFPMLSCSALHPDNIRSSCIHAWNQSCTHGSETRKHFVGSWWHPKDSRKQHHWGIWKNWWSTKEGTKVGCFWRPGFSEIKTSEQLQMLGHHLWAHLLWKVVDSKKNSGDNYEFCVVCSKPVILS